MGYRIVTPSQERIIEPSQQRISSLDFNSDPSYYLGHAFNRVLAAIGDNIILNGLHANATHDDTSITITIDPGQLIQDSTLLVTDSPTVLTLDTAVLFKTSGRIIVYSDWEYLYVQGGNYLKFAIDYVASDGTTANLWNSERFRTIIEIFEFSIDLVENKITGVWVSNDQTITIYDQEFYKYGYDISKSFGLDRYMKRFINSYNSDIHGASGSGYTGFSLLKTIVDGIIYLRNIQPGNNISLTTDSNNLIISATQQMIINNTEPVTPDINTVWIKRS